MVNKMLHNSQTLRRVALRPILTAVLSALALLWLPADAVTAQDGQPQPACLTENAPGCTFGLPTQQYNALLAEMKANPTPEVEPVPLDKEVNRYVFYKVLLGAEIYDAPNGNVLRRVDDGFMVVSVYGARDGFTRLRDGTWIKRSALKQTIASEFTGVRYQTPLRYPMAWVIQASIPSSVPGGVRRASTPAVARYTRLNIYAAVKVDGWDWFLVGPGQWLEQRKVAKINLTDRPEGAQKWVAIDLFEQVLTAYEGERAIFSTLISSGLPNTQTNIGLFKVYSKRPTTPMTGAMGQPNFWSLPSVPWVMFFDGDISLHGTYWHDGFGFKRSRGCVNLSISDAKWLYDWSGSDELTVKVWSSRPGLE
jgi:lipoprotein-anchoring transpeptidase ErfK/SrfK